MAIRYLTSWTSTTSCTTDYSERAVTTTKATTSKTSVKSAAICEKQSSSTTRRQVTSSTHNTPSRLAVGSATHTTTSCWISYRCLKISQVRKYRTSAWCSTWRYDTKPPSTSWFSSLWIEHLQRVYDVTRPLAVALVSLRADCGCS